MVLLDVVIPGDPVGKGRPRVTRTGHAFTPAKTRSWESGAAHLLRNEWGIKAPYDGPVTILVFAVGARPKGLLPKSMGGTAPLKRPPAPGRLWRTTKPDADNVVKAALDALQAAGVIRDDVQAVEVTGRSLYASLTEGPGVHIIMQTVPEYPG